MWKIVRLWNCQDSVWWMCHLWEFRCFTNHMSSCLELTTIFEEFKCVGVRQRDHQSAGEHLTSEPLHGPRQMKNSEWCCKNVCLWFCWRRNLGYFNCHLHTSRYAVVQNYCTGAFMSSDVWMERRMLICSVQFKSRTLAFLHACALVPISPWHCEDFFLCSC